MDDGDQAWRLAATSLSGFAIRQHHSSSPQYETLIHHSVEHVDIQISQTLETHPFPYYLQILLSPHTPLAQPGIVLLLPLNHIVHIVVANHAIHGQSLRFKLAEPSRATGVMRQSVLDGAPGRVFGPKQDDPYHLLGILTFREFMVRNADVGGQDGAVMNGWVDCLKRNALREYGHSIQILREDSDGIVSIAEEAETYDEMEEKMEYAIDGDSEGSLGISSLIVSDDTVHGDSPETEKREASEAPEAHSLSGSLAERATKHDAFEEEIDILPQHDTSPDHKQTPSDARRSTDPDYIDRSSDTSPDPHPQNAPSHQQPHPYIRSSPHTGPQFPQSIPRNPFLGVNTMQCHRRDPANRVNLSPQCPQTARPLVQRISNRYRHPGNKGNRFHRPGNQNNRNGPSGPQNPRQFHTRYRGPFSANFQNRHNTSGYDSYRPERARSFNVTNEARRGEHKPIVFQRNRKVPRPVRMPD